VLCLCCALAAVAAEDEPPPAAAAKSDGLIALDAAQMTAIGMRIARLPLLHAPEGVPAVGVILDSNELLEELGEARAAAAAAHASGAELARLRALNAAGGEASLRMVEAAEVDALKARAQSEAAAQRFSAHWDPLAKLPGAERQALIDRVAGGKGWLMRAAWLGRQSAGTIPRRALIAIDGVQVSGSVLGVMRAPAADQNIGLLICLRGAPAGLRPGARLALTLQGAPVAGRYLGRDAVFYDEKGAFVYERAAGGVADPAARNASTDARFRATRVKLLFPAQDGWLVSGIDADDEIVVAGAGALWSLQEMHGQAAAADDDD
jgi:hypothetical protein